MPNTSIPHRDQTTQQPSWPPYSIPPSPFRWSVHICQAPLSRQRRLSCYISSLCRPSECAPFPFSSCSQPQSTSYSPPPRHPALARSIVISPFSIFPSRSPPWPNKLRPFSAVYPPWYPPWHQRLRRGSLCCAHSRCPPSLLCPRIFRSVR